MRLPRLPAALIALAPLSALPDSVKPVSFGPYMTNNITYAGNPASYEKVLNIAYYRFQVGWIEPISESATGLFKDAYFETDGDFNLSPFQTDVGTTFSVKPIRYLEFGLSYNRLMFNNSLVAYEKPGAKMIPIEEALPEKVMRLDTEFGGADVFTFQGNLTFDMGPLQLFSMGSFALWDVDIPGKDFLYEYSSDLVIKPRDRIFHVQSQLNVDLSSLSRSTSWSFTGLTFQDRFWHVRNTEQTKHLISAGMTGIRFGRNPVRQKRGLDIQVGYLLDHPQVAIDDVANSITFLLHWKWSVQFLKL